MGIKEFKGHSDARSATKSRDIVRPARSRAASLVHEGRFWLAEAPVNLRVALQAALNAESDYRSGFLWLPVAFGLGILTYFSAHDEPALWAAPALATLLLALTWKTSGIWRALFMALLFISLGFAAATLRTALVASPVLERAGLYEVKGFVEGVESFGRRHRLVLRPVFMERVTREAMPYRIRVGGPGGAGIVPGQFVALRANLSPPAEAAMPGGYDFRREAYFRSLGAVGYMLGRARPEAAPGPAPLLLQANAVIDHWRNGLTERIARAIGDQAGALSAALITGKRGLITEETNDDLRASGLYHVVSISGLHMVLAAGILFWSLRALLAAFPAIALGHPIKKYAAFGGMLGASFYCVFSGSEVATERSLIMVLVMLGAILFDRPALAMRNLALSALIVLAREPEALLGPSFQMSFAAVASLIAANQIWRARKKARITQEKPVRPGLLMKIALSFIGILATTLIASLATAPFSAFHFHRINPLGLIGNALAHPMIELVVMPSAVIGTVLVPFGLDWIIWRIMGYGVGGVLGVADWVARLDYAVLATPRAPSLFFGIIIAALLVLVGFRTRLRWLSLPLLALWLMGINAAPLPDILIDSTGKMVLIKEEGGRYRLLSGGTANSFTLSQWLPALGDARPPPDASLREGVACDAGGCMARLADGRKVSLSLRAEALRADCQRADIIITPLAAQNACGDKNLQMVDKTRLERSGAMRIISAKAGDWQVETTFDPGSNRPWRRAQKRVEEAPEHARLLVNSGE